MASLADYVILTHEHFTLSGPNGHEDFTVEIPGDFVFGEGRSPIITFLMRPLSNQTSMRIEVNSNTVETVKTGNEDRMVVRTYTRAFSGSAIKKSQMNAIHLEVDEGEVRVSNVIIWFQRD